MTARPTDLTGVQRGALMHRSRRLKDSEAKAVLAELAASRRKTSDAVDAAQHDHDPLTGNA